MIKSGLAMQASGKRRLSSIDAQGRRRCLALIRMSSYHREIPVAMIPPMPTGPKVSKALGMKRGAAYWGEMPAQLCRCSCHRCLRKALAKRGSSPGSSP